MEVSRSVRAPLVVLLVATRWGAARGWAARARAPVSRRSVALAAGPAPVAMVSAEQSAEARELAAVIARAPHDGKAWMNLATLVRRRRDMAAAERVLLAAVRAQPDNALLWQALADTLHDSAQYAQARSVYRKALQLNASLGSAYHAWGRMEAALGNVETARTLFETGLTRGLPRPNPRLVHGMAVLLDGRLRETEAARQMLRVGLRHEPANPQLLHAIGLLEVNAGNVDAARVHLRKAVAVATPRVLPDLAPRAPPDLASRALQDLAPARQPDKRRLAPGTPVRPSERADDSAALAALAAAAPAAKKGPPFWQAAHALARLEDGAGNAQLARDVCMRGVEATAGAVQLWQLWAHLEEKHGRLTAARRVYERATAQHARDVMLWEQWARLEERAADLRTAALLFRRAIAADPRNADSYARYAALLLREVGAHGAPRTWGSAGAEQRSAALARARALYRRGASECALQRGSTSAHARRLSRLLYEWAVFEWKDNDRVQARVLFERALSVAQRDQLAWVLQLYARFEDDCGNGVVARHLAARSVNADRFDGSTWRLWGELEEAAGEYALAQELRAHAALQDGSHTLLFRKDGSSSADFGPDGGGAYSLYA